MAGMSKLLIIGNLGKDPEVQFSGTTALAKFTVGASDRIKTKDGWQDHTEWHNVVCFGKTAEACGQHLAKGAQVFVSGKMQTKEYEKNGEKKRWTEVIADDVQFLGSKRGVAPIERAALPAPSTDDIPF